MLLTLVLMSRRAECDTSCTIFALDKIGEYCTARIDCQNKLDFDLKTWNCIKHTHYEQQNRYNEYGYRQKVNTEVTNYDTNYYLKIYVKEPLVINSLLKNEKHVITLVLEHGDLVTVPEDVYKMENLRELNISGNNIGTVNLNKFLTLTSLNEIILEHNMIRVIEIDEENDASFGRQISGIQTIDMSNNFIEVLPNNFVSRFIQLQHLYLSHNMIGSIGLLTFEGIVQLQTLDLSHNKLLEIGHALARFRNLKELSISHNNITKLSEYNFDTLLNLEKLNASSNGITTIENNTFQALTKLKNLDLRYNGLKIITNQIFSSNVNLNSLFLSDNKIKSIEENSFNSTQIIEFCIQNNDLVGVLNKNAFKGVNVLELNLSNGNLTSIKDEAFSNMLQLNNLNVSSNSISNLSFSAFTSLVSLNILDLSHNKLKEFNFDSQSLKKLTKLYAHHNNIEKIVKDVFENFESLQELDISFNDIKQIEPRAFLKLNSIILFNIKNNDFVNSLESKALKGLTSLKIIDMTRAKTTHFQNESFSGLYALADVNYTFGQLAEIEYNAFLGIGNLEKLCLSNNQLHKFHINTSTISQIQEIYLNDNLITNISYEAFSHLTLLRILNLANNDIIKLNSDGFQDLKALTNLDLSFNDRMRIMGNPFQNLSRLYSLSLENVKWNISFENSSASIEILNLQYCGISDINNINIFNVHGLGYLYLSRNKITNIDKRSFGNINTLVSLDLSLNKIIYIQPGSFLNFRNLRSLNLYGNDLASVQFGVFDGIELLKDLNLSSNVFPNFDVKLVPNTEKLYLDDNIITDINFGDFLDRNLSELSIGGNQISCTVLAELKVSKYSEPFKRIVTAKTLNYHSENVNGITCQTAVNNTQTANNNQNQVSNNPIINISPLIATLRNVLEKLSHSLNVISENTNASNELKNTGKNIDKLLENIIESNKNSQMTNNRYLDQLTEINNISNVQLGQIKEYLVQLVDNNNKEFESSVTSNTKSPMDDQYLRLEFQKMLKLENDALREEFKDALASISKGNPIQESLIVHEKPFDDSKTVIYFMAACLAIMLSVYIGNIVFKQIIASRRSRSAHTCNSTSHITNSIEME